MGFLDKLTWKEYFLSGGLLIIWAIVAYAGINALIECKEVLNIKNYQEV